MNRWTTPTAALSSALAVLATLAQAPSALAQDAVPTPFGHNYGVTETARTAGLAGATRALGNGTAGLFLNPASIALNRLYHVEAIVQATPEVGRFMLGGAIVDSIMNRYGLAGGLAVAGGFNDAGPADWSTFDLRTALAYPITEKFMIGVAPRYASITHAFPDNKPKEDPDGDMVQLNLHTFTLDAGVTIRPTDALHVGFVAQNVVSNRRSTYPTLLGGGIGYGSDFVSVEVDGLVDLDSYEGVTMRLMGGGELLLAEHYPIRLGYRFDQGAKLNPRSAGLHVISAGLGYIGTTFGLEASLQRTLSDPGATTIVVGLAYYVETAGFMKSAQEGFEQ
jgi:opacity protein-like surface antigen